MPSCSHGELKPVTGRGRNNRYWAAYMCPDKNRDCVPQWIPDSEIYSHWLDSANVNVNVSSDADAKDDSPPF